MFYHSTSRHGKYYCIFIEDTDGFNKKMDGEVIYNVIFVSNIKKRKEKKVERIIIFLRPDFCLSKIL